MTSIIAGVVGPQSLTDGNNQPLRQGRSGEQIISELHGRYFEQAVRGNIYTASNVASTSSAGLATTYTGGVCLSNPAGSSKNLVVLKASVALVVISTAVTSAGLIAGWSQAGVVTHSTVLAPTSALLGSQLSPVGKVDQACTLVGTPAWVIAGFASTGIAAGVFAASIDLEGLIVVPPGGYVATATSIASPASGVLASITWEEVSI